MNDVLKIFIPVYGTIFAWRISREPTGGHAQGYEGIVSAILMSINICITLAILWAVVQAFRGCL